MSGTRPTTPPEHEKGDPKDVTSEQAEGLQPGHLNPPPTQLHRPRPRPGTGRRASEGPEQGQCTHVKAKTPLTRGNAVPEVGLELHSLPRKHWAPPEKCGIRPGPNHIRRSPKPKVCTLYTPPNWPTRRIPTKPLLWRLRSIDEHAVADSTSS